MSATPRKPSTPGNSNRSSTADSHTVNGTSSRTHTRSPSASTNGVSRSPSLRASTPVSARAAARKPGRSNLSTSSAPKTSPSPSDEEARAQNAALIDDLKEQLQKAETASEQYRKQLGVLQMRLDEAVSEQGKLEDQSHERDGKIEALNGEIREHVRQIRDLEQAHDLERNAMLQEKEQQASREEEMQATIQRLKESLAQKERANAADADKSVSRSSSFRNRGSPDVDGQFAPSSQIERSPSRNNSKLLLQKDKLIESLRLELAESQIKLVEMENKGGGRQRELEKELLEARMANARLMEDNESYQLLLSERTLNGDFTKGDFMQQAHPDTAEDAKEPGSGLGSLADELESVDARAETDNNRKLETEVKALKDQNKALTLYIERIISRLLQHDGFETILDKNENDPPKAMPAHSNKELPPTPPEKDDAQSFLQRAKSAVHGPNNRPLTQPRSRPTSYMPPPTSMPTAHENPETAPSIPLRAQSIRGHRRTRSEQTDVGAAAVVGQMYRGRNSGGPISPTLMGPGSRQSAFSGASIMSSMSAGGRAPSLSSQPEHSRLSSSDSITSDPAGDTASTGATSSSPRSSTGMTNYTGAVMTQNKLRPLRLVSETKLAEEEEAARKKANRGSWISWFNRPNNGEAPQPST
ncbi:M protein, serotype 2.1 precursor [Aspergillus sclerotiicarbonarius CBS 121057]|uniref:M protein, serotype 2.1 n=1 Tax=Aspergillus sclerotiicarbonarius (strain CBS 121057 / IBT 28362) TaxID=1448318 RepID=A0A319EAF9_ASPSB|nr:M protein, serotype 2.1 precursor [Aspergillus sclerotiicarbonarius CBS 121057]